jgi:hypothetical protein
VRRTSWRPAAGELLSRSALAILHTVLAMIRECMRSFTRSSL